MGPRHPATCTLCEAACGILVEVEGGRVASIRGDDDDPQSRGFLCPKATALADLHEDPDRLRRPLVRQRDARGERGPFREASWEEALDLAGARLSAIRTLHGRDALGFYYGNPTAHNLGLLTHGLPLSRALRTRNLYSASSADQLPQMLAAHEMFGHLGLVPVPDVDRTEHFLIVGANPLVSNGSLMTAPDMKRRLRAIRERGGRVVVLDPRRTETADAADEHVFVRPGTDAYLLLAMVRVLLREGRARLGRLGPRIDGLEALGELAEPFEPARAASRTGVPAATIVRLARQLADARRAVVYGRVGMCTQEHGTLAAWLVTVLNVLTGRLDEVGGAMFTTPAIDFLGTVTALGMARGHDRWRSRVRGLPETAGELPVATLADEIEVPGGVRGLLVLAGNPVLSAPHGARLDRALPRLDFMVSVDSYLNETSRHADVVLPPTSPLGRSHYDLALHAFGVRNAAKYVPPIFPRGPDERHDWEIIAHLSAHLLVPRALRRAFLAVALRGPEPILEAGLRAGPHGARRGRGGLSLRLLRQHPHGLDLGPLEPRLPGLLPRKRILLVTPLLAEGARSLAEEIDRPVAALVLVGRRHLRSNNSWLHNSARLVKGPERCTLLVHPEDARARGIEAGGRVRIRSRVGEVQAPVEISDEMMPGVVSLPHGWGHDRAGVRLGVATGRPGASVNDLTDDAVLDRLSGTAVFGGVPVEIEPV